MIERRLSMLHPKARYDFIRLAAMLTEGFEDGSIKSSFHPFETYRSPIRQQELWLKGDVTRARAWESAHQFGLAVDFVALRDGWSWADDEDWAGLRRTARAVGLICPIEWDKPHVVHPLWMKLRGL